MLNKYFSLSLREKEVMGYFYFLILYDLPIKIGELRKLNTKDESVFSIIKKLINKDLIELNLDEKDFKIYLSIDTINLLLKTEDFNDLERENFNFYILDNDLELIKELNSVGFKLLFESKKIIKTTNSQLKLYFRKFVEDFYIDLNQKLLTPISLTPQTLGSSVNNLIKSFATDDPIILNERIEHLRNAYKWFFSDYFYSNIIINIPLLIKHLPKYELKFNKRNNIFDNKKIKININ